MSYMKVSGMVAAMVTSLAIAGGAYGDSGKSPNGAPGPAGNPNQPTSQPQANAPQGPAGNGQDQNQASHGKSTASHGKSTASHGKSEASHGKSEASHGKSGSSTHGKSGSAKSRTGGSHANPSPGTPKKTHSNNGHAGKITICHATKSVKNPYVEITISVNGLHGHGPAEDPHHHAGSWKDIIPAPAGGCPGTVQQQSGSTEQPGASTPTTTAPSTVAAPVVPAPEVAATAPAPGSSEVLGARESGGNAPAGSTPGASKVLGARASGNTAPAATLAARATDNRGGSLPFTGFQLAVVLIAAAVALLGGFALRRATASSRS